MNSPCAPLDSLPAAASPALKVTIIYEDFASGTRARMFAERLAKQLACDVRLSESIWRCELLELAPLAAAAARDAAECDYLIVSLHGEHLLPRATREWIEARLDGEGGRGMGVILLSDTNQGKWRVAEATRHYLRAVCTANSVAFFSHAMAAPVAGRPAHSRDGEEAVAHAFREVREMPALLHA